MVAGTFGVAVLDLVGFSLHSDEVQLKVIVRYQCEVRRALHGKPVRATISIGDGTILVFGETQIPNMPEHLFAVDHALAGYNLDFGFDDVPEISWRMGVHVGQAFIFKDINRQENFVGSALNVAQRVSTCVPSAEARVDFRERSPIYVSKEAYEAFRKGGLGAEFQFHDVGEREVKHGDKIHVFAMHKATMA